MKAKTLFLAISLMAGTLVSCTDYQDEIDALDKRVYVLENLVSKANDNIKAMEVLVNTMAGGWVITGYVDVSPDVDPEGIGYKVLSLGKIDPSTGELSKASADKAVITVHNGLKGLDGKDAQVPDIKLTKDPEDGNYYWTVNGVWLRDPQGNKIKANGNDGKDGKDGLDGKDGQNGKDGADGQDGKESYTIKEIYQTDDSVVFVVRVSPSGIFQTLVVPKQF